MSDLELQHVVDCPKWLVGLPLRLAHPMRVADWPLMRDYEAIRELVLEHLPDVHASAPTASASTESIVRAVFTQQARRWVEQNQTRIQTAVLRKIDQFNTVAGRLLHSLRNDMLHWNSPEVEDLQDLLPSNPTLGAT